MNKEILEMLANKLMFTMNDSEYDTLLEEFDVMIKQMDLIGKIDGIENVEPMSYPFTLDDVCLRDDEVLDELEIDDAMEYRFLEWNGGNVSSVKHKGKIGHTNWYIDDFDDYFIYNYCEVAPGMSGCAAVAEDGSYIGMMIGGVDNESGALSAKTIAGLYESMR